MDCKISGTGYDLLIFIKNVVHCFLTKLEKEKYSFQKKKLRTELKRLSNILGILSLRLPNWPSIMSTIMLYMDIFINLKSEKYTIKKGESIYLNSGDWIGNLPALKFLCNAGFETPAEALFMKKKLYVIPIHNQYEQECNACALDVMGVMNSKKLLVDELLKWISSDVYWEVDYPDDTENIFVNEVLPFGGK